jgi:hypothetical protein
MLFDLYRSKIKSLSSLNSDHHVRAYIIKRIASLSQSLSPDSIFTPSILWFLLMRWSRGHIWWSPAGIFLRSERFADSWAALVLMISVCCGWCIIKVCIFSSWSSPSGIVCARMRREIQVWKNQLGKCFIFHWIVAVFLLRLSRWSCTFNLWVGPLIFNFFGLIMMIVTRVLRLRASSRTSQDDHVWVFRPALLEGQLLVEAWWLGLALVSEHSVDRRIFLYIFVAFAARFVSAVLMPFAGSASISNKTRAARAGSSGRLLFTLVNGGMLAVFLGWR